MTRIDFYQIESNENALVFTCRLIDKIYHRGHKIHIHTNGAGQSRELDELLWSFRENRFIPHAICTTPQDQVAEDENVMVKMSHCIEPSDHQEILINLSGLVPDFFSRFERIAEVVPLDESSRTSARENYKFYKDRGYPLQYHQMRGK